MIRIRSIRALCLAGLLVVGSPALPVAAQTLTFEEVGDIPIDAEDIEFGPSGTLWAGARELLRLAVGSSTWEVIYDEPGSIGEILLVLSADTLFLSSFSGVSRSVDMGQTFMGVHFEGNRMFSAALNGPNNGVILTGEQQGGSGIAYSTDRGASFTEATFTVVPGSRPTMETAVEIPDGPATGRIVAGVFGGVVVSEDGGQTWSPSSLFQSARYRIQRMVIGIDPTTGERRLYASGYDTQKPFARLYVSDDDGATWVSTSTFDWTFFLAAVPPPPEGDGTLLAMTGADGVVFRSSDGGTTFEEVGQVPFPFTGHVANDMLIGPDGRLYVAVGRTGPERAWVYSTTEPVVVSSEAPPDIPTEETTLRVYPNPATNHITIQTDAEEVEILDVLGRVVLRSSSDRVDVSSIPNGVYAVRAGNETARVTIRR